MFTARPVLEALERRELLSWSDAVHPHVVLDLSGNGSVSGWELSSGRYEELFFTPSTSGTATFRHSGSDLDNNMWLTYWVGTAQYSVKQENDNDNSTSMSSAVTAGTQYSLRVYPRSFWQVWFDLPAPTPTPLSVNANGDASLSGVTLANATASRWYKYTAVGAGSINVVTVDPDYDTGYDTDLFVYNASGVEIGSESGGDNDDDGNWSGTVAAGDTLYFQVRPNISDDYSGRFNLSIDGPGGSPEISVSYYRGGPFPLALADGAGVYDFGSVAVGASANSQSLNILNGGAGSLTLSGNPKVQIGGANASDFTVTTQPASPVAANGSTSFQLVFSPTAGGLRTATVTIPNNDSDESPYNFTIQGTGLGPEIDVQGNGLSIGDGDTSPAAGDGTDFGAVNVSAGTVTRTFTIRNTGNSALNLTGNPKVQVTGANAADFVVTALPASSVVTAGGSLTFQVTFDPGAGGLRTATLSLANDDANENPYNFTVKGTGTVAASDNDDTLAEADGRPLVTLSSRAVVKKDSIGPAGTDDADYRRFKLGQNGKVTLKLSGLAHNADLYLYNSGGGLVAKSVRAGTAVEKITKTLKKGRYYVAVLTADGLKTNYSLSMLLAPLA